MYLSVMLTTMWMFVCIGSPIGCRIYTAKVILKESFLASVEDLYDALTEKKVQ